MLQTYHSCTAKISEQITRFYTTSFSTGIKLLDQPVRQAVYDIYSFVRLGDEIVDTFKGYNQKELLAKFKQDTYQAIQDNISTNPVLHRFQITVNEHHIDKELIESYFQSMEMDLSPVDFEQQSYNTYIYGSAEVVGLMCLTTFVSNTGIDYESLKSMAKMLGSVLQKINFLRDIAYDYNELQRSYFPNVDIGNFQEKDKQKILEEIYGEFYKVKQSIMQLPHSSRYGVYIIYMYYFTLYKKIKRIPASKLLQTRIRVSDVKKILIFINIKIRKAMRW